MMFHHELQAKVTELVSVQDKLNEKNSKFASDLINSFHKYGKLTVYQEPWIQKLIDIATKPVYPQSKPTILEGSFDGMVNLFNLAKTHLKHPKIALALLLPETTETQQPLRVYLSVGGKTSKYAGDIIVVGEGTYPNRPWYGRITQEGLWCTSSKLSPVFADKLTALLQEFSSDPHGVAQKCGKLLGLCCFCGSPLSDPKSTAVGYGPTCASHFGLTEKWKAAASKALSEKEFIPKSKTLQYVGSVVSEGVLSSVVSTSTSTYTGEIHKKQACYLCGSSTGIVSQDNFILCLGCANELNTPVPQAGKDALWSDQLDEALEEAVEFKEGGSYGS